MITVIFSACLIVILLLFRSLFILWKSNLDLKDQNKDLNVRFSKDFEETLSLATSEQLLKELRIRKGIPYILLVPIKEKDFNGITIESHGINQFSCFAMLHLAKAITAQNFKNNGIEPPKLPPISDYFN